MPDQMRRFGELKLRGGRYEESGFPVETLSELARYERLVLDVAKSIWKSSRQGRQRVPRGFAAQFQLRLTRLEDGSVTPILERPSESSLFDDGESATRDVFEEARVIIEETMSAISGNLDLPKNFPEVAYGSLTQFGASLRNEERIEFLRNSEVVAVYNNEARKNFISRVRREKFPVEGTVVGWITELNTEVNSFILNSVQENQIQGRYSAPEMTEDFVAVIHDKSVAPIVRVEGRLTSTLSGETIAIEDVRSLELFEQDNEPWSSRFLEILSLRPGWDGHSARAISVSAIEFSREVLRRVTSSGRPQPGIFPVPDGGIQLEWQTDSLIASVEVAANLDDVDLYCLYRRDKSSAEESTKSAAEAAKFVQELNW